MKFKFTVNNKVTVTVAPFGSKFKNGDIGIIKAVERNTKTGEGKYLVERADGYKDFVTENLIELVAAKKFVITRNIDGVGELHLYNNGISVDDMQYKFSADELEDILKAVRTIERIFDRYTNAPKFEVGKYYKHSEGYIIKITSIDGYWCHYKLVVGGEKYHSMPVFAEDSDFSKHLTLYCPERLFGEFVCVSKDNPNIAFTVGKVYIFKDGKVVADNGAQLYTESPVRSIYEWNEIHNNIAKFAELIE